MTVNNSLLMPILDDKVRMLNVKFVNNDGNYSVKCYTYKCDDPSVQPDDYVVVEARGWYQVAVVEGTAPMPEIDSDTTYRWIVCRVDTDDHQNRLDVEDALIKRTNRIRAESIRKQMLAALGVDDPNGLLRIAHEDVFEDDDNAS